MLTELTKLKAIFEVQRWSSERSTRAALSLSPAQVQRRPHGEMPMLCVFEEQQQGGHMRPPTSSSGQLVQFAVDFCD